MNPLPPIEYPPVEAIEPPPAPPAANVATSSPAPTPPPVSVVPSEPAPEPVVVASTARSTLPAVPIVPVEDLQLLALLGDLNRYGTYSPDELKRELGAATQALARERTDLSRIRLAVLYSLMRTGPTDDQRALQLLDNVAKSPGGPSAPKQLAALLQVQIAERLRAVRDEQVKANDALQKLEALRAMERQLLRDRVRSGGGGGGGAAGGSGGSGGGSGGGGQ